MSVELTAAALAAVFGETGLDLQQHLEQLEDGEAAVPLALAGARAGGRPGRVWGLCGCTAGLPRGLGPRLAPRDMRPPHAPHTPPTTVTLTHPPTHPPTPLCTGAEQALLAGARRQWERMANLSEEARRRRFVGWLQVGATCWLHQVRLPALHVLPRWRAAVCCRLKTPRTLPVPRRAASGPPLGRHQRPAAPAGEGGCAAGAGRRCGGDVAAVEARNHHWQCWSRDQPRRHGGGAAAQWRFCPAPPFARPPAAMPPFEFAASCTSLVLDMMPCSYLVISTQAIPNPGSER